MKVDLISEVQVESVFQTGGQERLHAQQAKPDQDLHWPTVVSRQEDRVHRVILFPSSNNKIERFTWKYYNYNTIK